MLTAAPVGVGHWRQWIGSIDADLIEASNLWLIAKQPSQTPGVIDHENRDLRNDVWAVFLSLLLSGTPYYDAAYLLTGAYVPGENPRIRQYRKLDRYLVSFGGAPLTVDAPHFTRAAADSARVRTVYLGQSYITLRRGFHVFTEGLRAITPQERIHQFVRAIEAIVKPGRYDIKRTVVQRVRTLAIGGRVAERVMRQSYDLRSKEEHLSNWEEALRYVARTRRGDVLVRRVRQMEDLARRSYSRIFRDEQSLAQFSDADIDSFWGMTDRARLNWWGRAERARILMVV